ADVPAGVIPAGGLGGGGGGGGRRAQRGGGGSGGWGGGGGGGRPKRGGGVGRFFGVYLRGTGGPRGAVRLGGPRGIARDAQDCDAGLSRLATARGRWVDLGTGAGFPGIIFAARFAGEGCSVELVDSRRKRCVFLEHVLAAAGVSRARVAVHCVTVESLPSGA